ncbi:unnamed protein product [Adineta ricciae]|uniref:Uncharacterized protein n=1 Tax=Adineta ricciae TaxID=249248 RepID=A0A814GBV7_ADIRI|nr:unnamed protein product [Adineta ricciae]CAF1171982.1 unnamed protein product [Adineta ricciae]
MSYSIILLIIGSQNHPDNKTLKSIPIPSANLPTPTDFSNYCKQITNQNLIVVFIPDPNEQIFPLIRQAIEEKRSQFIGVFICTPLENLAIQDLVKVYDVSETLIPYKIISTISKFLGFESIKQFDAERLETGLALEKQSNDFFKKLGTNHKYEPCHILLIPFNATARDLHRAEQRLRNIYSDLAGSGSDFVVHTLDKYIPRDELNYYDPRRNIYLNKHYGGDACLSIMDLSMMIFFVVGNLDTLNPWSEQFLCSLKNTTRYNSGGYLNGITFVADRFVRDEYLQNLFPRFGTQFWAVQQATPKALDYVKNDIDFQADLLSIGNALEHHGQIANIKIEKRASDAYKSTTAFSSNDQLIQQAASGPADRYITDIDRAVNPQ